MRETDGGEEGGWEAVAQRTGPHLRFVKRNNYGKPPNCWAREKKSKKESDKSRTGKENVEFR